MNESYRNCLSLYSVEVNEDRSSLETSESSRGLYDIITIDYVLPIESARAWFIQIVTDHFIDDSLIEVFDSDADYGDQDKMNRG
ncbi:unnamed protein product [Vicia faba]|uniref:Uncharacterized protein n=1 Tax=Vicia faba TaxID=3906 RepID=A0AAV1ATE0_VICFA|nr:unnamed protein product [Vicia faba]